MSCPIKWRRIDMKRTSVRFMLLCALLVSIQAMAGAGQTATLLKPVKIKIPYGETVLPAGTKVEVVSRDGNVVRVSYMDSIHSLPIDALKIESVSPGAGQSPGAPSSPVA